MAIYRETLILLRQNTKALCTVYSYLYQTDNAVSLCVIAHLPVFSVGSLYSEIYRHVSVDFKPQLPH